MHAPCSSFLLTLGDGVLSMPIAHTDMVVELTQHSSKQWLLLEIANEHNVIHWHGLFRDGVYLFTREYKILQFFLRPFLQALQQQTVIEWCYVLNSPLECPQ